MDTMVREAIPEDAEGIAIVLRELGWFEHIISEPETVTIQRVLQRLQLCNADQSHSVYVAEASDGHIMGYAGVHWLPTLYMKGIEGYVSELFILEDERDQGVGTLLLDHIQLEARNRGCYRLSLINMKGRESYHRQFYLKNGWEERESAANFVLFLR